MRKCLTVAACVAVAIAPAAAAGGSAKDVFADVSGGVVVVIALDAEGAPTSQGSGVVVGRNEVATSCHVVSGAKDITVRQAADARGREAWRMTARLAARNEARDLCLLFVEELSDPPAAVPVRLGSARAVSVGEEVYAIGAPRGLTLSLSRGVVSQLRGDYGKRSAPIIQTDAAISPGSSGGGLFNGKGELIGITSFKFRGAASEGLSFAAPAEWVRDLASAGQERAACFSPPTADCLLAEAMRAAGRIGDAYWRAMALGDIAGAQAQAGDEAGARGTFAEAVRVAGRIGAASRRATALADIVEAQAQAGDIAGALRTAVRMGDAFLHVWVAALRDIVEAQAQAGDIAGALRTVGRIGGASAPAKALGDIAGAQAQAGDIAGALRTAVRIGRAFPRAGALRDIAGVQAQAGDEAGARGTFADAVRAAGRIRDAYFRAAALGDIAGVQAQAGDEAGARGTFADAVRVAGRIRDASARAGALGDIAGVQAQAGDEAGALRTVERIGVALWRAGALGDIAGAQAQAGDIAGALRTAGRIGDAFRRAVALAVIAGRIDRAE